MTIGTDERGIARIEEPSRRHDNGYRYSDDKGMKRNTRLCRNCGFELHPHGKRCPAYSKKCNNCSKYNHFASVCRSKPHRQTMVDSTPSGGHRPQKRHRIKRMEETEEDSDVSLDKEFLTKSTAHMQIKKVKKAYGLDKTVSLMVNDIHIQVEPDMGADVNVMNVHQYRALQHRSEYDVTLRESQTKLRTLQNDLPVKGQFDATVRNQTCGKRTTFLVIKGRINSAPLINKNTLIQLWHATDSRRWG